MRHWLKRNYYRLTGKNVKIGRNVIFNTGNKFEGNNVVDNNAVMATSHVGYGTYIADGAVLKYTKVGRFCSIGSNVQTGMGTHPSEGFVSTHPAFYSTQMQSGFSFVDHNLFPDHRYADADNNYICVIGNDVWIGNNVLIMDGITIGHGSIVAAGAVVTKDVAPYTIVGGVPAKFIKNRFTPEQADRLLDIQWWNWDIDKIKASSHLFQNIEQFISTVK